MEQHLLMKLHLKAYLRSCCCCATQQQDFDCYHGDAGRTQVCACCSIVCSFVASICVCMLCLWFVVRKHHFVLLGANQDLMLFDIMLFDPYTVILQLSAATAVRTAASACCNPCSLVNFCLYVHNTSHVNISILFLLRRTHKPPTK